MKKLFSWIIYGVKHPNPEIQQGMMRLVILFFIGGAIGIHSYTHQWPNYDKIILALSSFFVHGLILYFIILKWPSLNPARRIYGIFIDTISISSACWFGGMSSATYAFVFTWICIGNGYRYGPNYMIAACVTSISSLVYVIKNHPQWNTFTDFENAIILFNIVISFYVWVVLHRTVQTRDAVSAIAIKDDLTGLPNRIALNGFLTRSIENAMLTHIPVACIYFDLDGFKQVNDTYGHQLGDKLLVKISQDITSAVHPHDLFARISGDEFVIILIDNDSKEKAKRLAQYVLEKITSIKQLDGKKFDIGASIGVCFYEGLDNVDADSFLKKADELMYESKKAGKKRITVQK